MRVHVKNMYLLSRGIGGAAERPAGFFQCGVAVRYIDILAHGAQMCAERLADGDGAMRTAGTADGDHQPALALFLIKRKEIVNQLIQMIEERTRLLHAQHIVAHGRFQTGICTDLLNIERIGQETHVKYEIALTRNS